MAKEFTLIPRPEVLIVGGGMIVHDQILPSLYHLQRQGVVAEIAVALVLLVGAGLMLKSVRALLARDPLPRSLPAVQEPVAHPIRRRLQRSQDASREFRVTLQRRRRSAVIRTRERHTAKV